jgi:hypothetical protein
MLGYPPTWGVFKNIAIRLLALGYRIAPGEASIGPSEIIRIKVFNRFK